MEDQVTRRTGGKTRRRGGGGVEKEVKKGSWGGRVDTKGQGGKKRSERKQTEAYEDGFEDFKFLT